MDIFSFLVCYVYLLVGVFCLSALWNALNVACLQVTGTSFQSMLSSSLAEAALAASRLPYTFWGAVAQLTEGKAKASPRYFF